MTPFERQLNAALRVLDEALNPLGFMKSRQSTNPQMTGKPAALPATKPDPTKFTKAPYFVEPHLIQQLATNPRDQHAFDQIAAAKGKQVAIMVRDALMGKAETPAPRRTFETGGYGEWGA